MLALAFTLTLGPSVNVYLEREKKMETLTCFRCRLLYSPGTIVVVDEQYCLSGSRSPSVSELEKERESERHSPTDTVEMAVTAISTLPFLVGSN